jgi:site-specific recombinase XerD
VIAPLRTRTDDSPYLFITNHNMPLERRSYWDLLQKYSKLAVVPKEKRRFHSLRRSIAVHLLDVRSDAALSRIGLDM